MREIETSQAPKPIGPYSQAVRLENMLYCSGQVALDPTTGKMDNASLQDETRRVLTNLGEVLKKGGSNFKSVVKVSIFLTDMDFFQEVNAVYAEFFTDFHPARETVAVKALPAGARVEISCIAFCQS
jgi:2-iminobutanoate/2-iminopropanoate deaminase